MPSVSKQFTYLFYLWRKYGVTFTFMTLMSCDSACCMCGEAWSSRWSMTQLTNGEHACVLVFVPMVDIFNMPCDCQFVFFVPYLMNFMLHTTLDAVGNILRVHYRSMKCEVSFSQDSVSTLFRWGEHVFHVYIKCLPVYRSAIIIKKNQTSFSRSTVIFQHSSSVWEFEQTRLAIRLYRCASSLRISTSGDPIFQGEVWRYSGRWSFTHRDFRIITDDVKYLLLLTFRV